MTSTGRRVLRAPERQGAYGGGGIYTIATPLVDALASGPRRTRSPCSRRHPSRGRRGRRVLPYVFAPTTWWSQNTAKIRFIGQRAGGMAQLKGLKIEHVYQDNESGRVNIPILDTQAAHYGFTVQHWPSDDRGSTRRRPGCVKVAQPNWVILRAQGVMTGRPEGSGPVRVPPRQDRRAAPSCSTRK